MVYYYHLKKYIRMSFDVSKFARINFKEITRKLSNSGFVFLINYINISAVLNKGV